MIKSNLRGFGFWFIATITVVFFCLFVSAISHYYFDVTLLKISMISKREAYVQIILLGIAFILFASITFQNSLSVTIDTFEKQISLKNLISRKKINFFFHELDGYVETFQKDGHRKPFIILYLIKNRRYIAKISGWAFTNIDELKTGLVDLKYLGQRRFSALDSLKELFAIKKIDE